MDKRGLARIEVLCATKAAGDDYREVDEKNGCSWEAKGQQTRPARRPSPVICSRPRQIRMRPITDAAACCALAATGHAAQDGDALASLPDAMDALSLGMVRA